jgi:folate-dependent phosphoribosylglycinamide formyltransferase PurN
MVHSSIKSDEIKAELAFVFCSREPGESEESNRFIHMVENYHIPFVCLSYANYRSRYGASSPGESGELPRWRLGYDREVMKALHGFNPDLCVLAGYMLVVGKEMCQQYDMINLHPAAPSGPTGTWQEVIWKLIESNARETGVMMHLVTPELDKGPPVTYCTFPVRGAPFDKYWREIEGFSVEQIQKGEGENNALFRLIREHGLVREFPLIVATIKAFSEGRMRVTRDKKMMDVEGNTINGYNLTEEIDEKVKNREL